jgi:hypothetical protein
VKASQVTRASAPDGLRRVETGAVQFGEDWPGLFIRGDEAIAIVFSIRHLKERVAGNDDILDHWDLVRLTRIGDMIERDVIVRRATA